MTAEKTITASTHSFVEVNDFSVESINNTDMFTRGEEVEQAFIKTNCAAHRKHTFANETILLH